MNFIQELDDLKAFVAGLARTDIEFCSMPLQHGFLPTATVESVLSKIDQIKFNWIKGPGAQTEKSAAAYTLRYFVDQSDLDFDTRYYLLEVANMIENEKENYCKKLIFSSDASFYCRALAEYIQSYVENEGPHTKSFIDGIYSYLNEINEEIKKLRKKSEDTLMIKIKKIIDRN